jgi:shikimate kinase
VDSLRQIRNLALIGFMGTGKTTVGRQLAEILRFDFVDTDDLIERRVGRPVREIFNAEGEARFRDCERALVATLPNYDRTVIATGGGLAADSENLASLKTHALVVCLWASPDKIYERVRHQSHRPLLNCADPMEKIRELLAARELVYRQADVLINTEFRQSREVVQHVLHEFHAAREQQP